MTWPARDDDGFYWYKGRTDDVIKSAGYRIGPAEIEDCLLKHPAVANAAVIGVPDEERGARIKACIVLRPDAAPRKRSRGDPAQHVRAAPGSLPVPARDRIHRRAADDHDRQDPAAGLARALAPMREGRGESRCQPSSCASFASLRARRIRARYALTACLTTTLSVTDSLQRFLFEGAPVRGEIVHLDATWRAVLERHDYPAAAARRAGRADGRGCAAVGDAQVRRLADPADAGQRRRSS